ncbi:MAG: hypothetical protein L0Z07_09935 [Planctomycetes bacterium]|nr:hypothetical protein [Planctomycetota bacterium]
MLATGGDARGSRLIESAITATNCVERKTAIQVSTSASRRDVLCLNTPCHIGCGKRRYTRLSRANFHPGCKLTRLVPTD